MSTLTARNIRKRLGLSTVNRLTSSATFVMTAGAANIANVKINFNTGAVVPITVPRAFDVMLSDASNGVGLTATTASGTVTAASAAGAVIGTYTAKKALRVQTLADGTFTLEITDTAKTGFYVVVIDPVTGHHYVSTQLITANYG